MKEKTIRRERKRTEKGEKRQEKGKEKEKGKEGLTYVIFQGTLAPFLFTKFKRKRRSGMGNKRKKKKKQTRIFLLNDLPHHRP